MSQRVKYSRLLTIFLLIFIVVFASAVLLYFNTMTEEALMSSTRDDLRYSAAMIASQINGDEFQLLQSGQESSISFVTLRDSLHAFLTADPSIKYIYTMRKNQSSVEFVVDADYGYSANAARIGQVYPEKIPALLEGFEKPTADDDFNEDSWGYVLSGYAPIRNHENEVVGIAGIDMDRQDVVKKTQFINKLLFASCLCTLVLIIGLAFVIDTRRARAEEEVEIANHKVNLLNSIVRHDLLNTLTGLIGYIDMAREDPSAEEMPGLIEKISEQTTKIHKQVIFTRDYQDLGLREPVWQDLDRVFCKASAEADRTNVRITSDCEGISVLADPLLVRVFYNLLENSLLHGRSVTAIRLSCRLREKDLVLLVEDNGIGIPDERKEGIFTRQYYEGTGLGLLLCREILTQTGMSVTESGTPGKGARFEIHVPRKGWRKKSV